MLDVAVLGAGRIGVVVADLLASSGDYRVTIADKNHSVLDDDAVVATIARETLDIGDRESLAQLLRGKYAVLSAAPYKLTATIAEAASTAGVNYLDLTEDVASTRHVRLLAEGAKAAFIPQCGLAPGFVSILAHDMAQRFDVLDTLRLRVGALPRFPANALSYNLTWSVDGLINECCEPCEGIVDRQLCNLAPLEGLERFALEGVVYEAFNTSGGLGSLCETYLGRVRELNYRSIRYPGHQALMKVLLQDLRLSERRHLLKDILEHAIPETLQDVVVVFVLADGFKRGQHVQETAAGMIYGKEIDGRLRSAIQVTTASGICAVLDLLAKGEIKQHGFVRQEDVPLSKLLRNRFGRVFAGCITERPIGGIVN
ncbi:MAG: saccharopine dehydrogenase family protein [Hyphomicrobiales bacterium]